MTDGIWGDASQQIWIDGEGNRFVNEYAERDVLAKASLALDNGIFYIIYAGNETNENGMLTGATLDNALFGTSVQSMVDNGHVWYGSTSCRTCRSTLRHLQAAQLLHLQKKHCVQQSKSTTAMLQHRKTMTSAKKFSQVLSTSTLSKQILTEAL